MRLVGERAVVVPDPTGDLVVPYYDFATGYGLRLFSRDPQAESGQHAVTLEGFFGGRPSTTSIALAVRVGQSFGIAFLSPGGDDLPRGEFCS